MPFGIKHLWVPGIGPATSGRKNVANADRAGAGSKFEKYTLSGWDAQPSVRLLWAPDPRQSLWGAISRAVRIPTQFDQDLRVTAGPLVLITGSPNFKRENLTAYEIGYRVLPVPRLS